MVALSKKHVTNASLGNYKEFWQRIFPEHYLEKYMHQTGFSGGGDHHPFYDIHLKQDVFLIPEHRFCLASSVEYFDVPDDYYLRTWNKSTIARLGLSAEYVQMHTQEPQALPLYRKGCDTSFSTLIDNGFKGWLTIEIVNNTNAALELKAGQPILTVEPQKCLFPCKKYAGKYQDQPDRPTGPR